MRRRAPARERTQGGGGHSENWTQAAEPARMQMVADGFLQVIECPCTQYIFMPWANGKVTGHQILPHSLMHDDIVQVIIRGAHTYAYGPLITFFRLSASGE